MHHSREDIVAFVAAASGRACPITGSTDIFDDLGNVGDDFNAILEEYAEKFHVDMTGYIWYFHNIEEGSPGLGGLFFKAPYDRVERIPVTVDMLAEFAPAGRWSIDYPPHEIPAYRYDILIDEIIWALLLAAALYLIFS